MKRTRAAICLLALVASSGWASPLRAAESAAERPSAAEPDAARVLRFRRVYVPRSQIERLATGHMPMERSEFRRRLQRANQRARTARSPATRVESAWYYAVHEDHALTGGTARLQVVHDDDQPGSLRLDPCRLAIGPVRWLDAERVDPSLAGRDADGRFVVPTERSGTLQFSWSLQGTAAEFGETVYSWTCVPALRSRLVLDVPRGFAPAVDQGVLTRWTAEAGPDVPPAVPALRAGRARWVVDVGGARHVRLRLAPENVNRQRSRSIQLRQESVYQLTDDALQLRSRLLLDIADQPPTELLLHVDRELVVSAVRLNGSELSWQPVHGAQRAARAVRIALPASLTPGPQTLTVSAMSSLRTDASWRLPRVLAPRLFWIGGTMTLDVPPSIRLCKLTGDRATPRTVQGMSGELSAQARGYQLSQPDATLEVLLRRRKPVVLAQLGTTIRISRAAMTVQSVVDLRSEYGQQFTFAAELAAGWTIDQIEAEPANALENYQIANDPPGARQLQIHLDQPVTPNRSVRLIVRAHRTQESLLTTEHFRPLRLRDVDVIKQLVAVVTDTGYRLRVAEDAALQTLDPSRLAASDQQRLAPDVGQLVFEDDAGADDLVIRVAREDPMFSAAIEVSTEVGQDMLTESYRIVCQPESAPISRVLIRLSEARAESPQWKLVGAPDGLVRADRSAAERAAKGTSPRESEGETWELYLRQPASEPFTFEGRRSVRFTGPTPVSLATLPTAASQDGTLTVEARDGQQLNIDARAVRHIPIDPTPAGHCPTMRARYRYDPSHNAHVTIAPVDARHAAPRAWAWSGRLVSHFDAHGSAVHRAVFRLENMGLPGLAVHLPAASTLLSLAVDGQPISLPAQQPEDGRVTLGLPRGQRFVRVELVYRRAVPPLGLGGQLRGALPALDVPVLDKRWSVWLPPGYTVQPQAAASRWPGGSDRQPTWPARLLGPLAASGERPFRLWAASDWRRLGSRPRHEPTTRRHAQLVLRLIGESFLDLKSDPAGPEVITWRDLAREIYRLEESTPGGLPVTLLVDTVVLADEGFTLAQPLPGVAAAVPIDIGVSLLGRANLALLAHGSTVLLTTATGWSRFSESLAPSPWRTVALVSTGTELARALTDSTERAQAGRLPVGAWIARPSPPQDPWPASRVSAGVGLASAPGRVLELSLGETGTTELGVYRTSWLQAFGWAALLASAGLLGLLLLRAPRWVLPALAVIASVSLLVPALWVPVTSRSVLGALLGLGLVATRRIIPTRRTATESASTHTHVVWDVGIAGMILAILLLVWSSRRAHAQLAPPGSSADHPASPAYRVLIPVDEERRPVGQYNYLPLELYDAIHQQSREGNGGQHQWLVRNAEYEARFAWSRQLNSLDLTSLSAVYRLELLEPQQTVRLPWPGKNGPLEILEARLAGRPVELRWSEDEATCALDIAETGLVQLELVLRPRVQQAERFREIRFPIPAVPHAVLRVEAPADAADFEVPTAVGARSAPSDSGARQFNLGPASALHLRWPTGAPSSGTRPLESDQLMWLQIDPSSPANPVLLQARFTFRRQEAQPQHVTLLGDPRLEWLPPDAASEDDAAPEPVVQRRGPHRAFRFTVPESAPGPWTLQATFAVNRVTALGHLPVPYLETESAITPRRWLAVSVPARMEAAPRPLHADEQPPDELEASEFLAAWGAAEATPAFAVDLPAALPAWYVAADARPPRTEAAQQLNVRIGARAMEWVFQAQMQTELGTVFQHRLQVPPGTEIQSVVLTREDAIVSSVAEQAEPGQLTVFLARGVEGQYLLELRGRQTLEAGTTEVVLPQVALLDADVRQNEVYVFRQTSILVDVPEQTDLPRAVPAQPGFFHETFGRLVTAWDLASTAGAAAPIVLRLRPNRPQPALRMVTQLLRIQDRWEAEVELEVRVGSREDAVLDILRLSVPAEWSGPFSIEPTVAYRLRALPGQTRRHLILRPARPIQDRYQVRIRAPLELNANERVRTPDVVPLDMASVDRYIVLPTQLDQQQIDWETRGLQPVPLQRVRQTDVSDRSGMAAYRVWSRYQLWSKPQATIAEVRRVAGERQISMADVHLTCPPGDVCYGVATFQLEPAGAASCTLAVPAQMQLLQVKVDTIPATLVPLADHRWHIRLGPDQLPQQITAVFRSRSPLDRAAGNGQLPVPWITDFPVVRTLWSLRSDPGLTVQVAGLQRHRVDAARQTTLRLANLANEIESAAEIVLDNPPDEIADWYAPWAIRLAAAVGRHARQRRVHADQPTNDESLRALEQRQLMVAEGLRTTSVLEDALRQSSEYPQPADLWATARHPGSSIARYAFIGSRPSLPVVVRQPASNWWSRVVAGAVPLLFGLLVYAARRHPLIRGWPSQWPFLVGVLLGIGWWLYCRPSLLGWVIVTISVFGALRPPVPRQRADQSDKMPTVESDSGPS